VSSRSTATATRVLLGTSLAALLGTSLAAPGALAAPLSHTAWDQLAPLGVDRAWELSTGAGVTVAVLDSGVDASHPDLAGRVLPGKDYVDDATADARVDPVGHGTAVASLIAGSPDGYVSGLAPDATILPVRVLDADNRYRSAATVAEGLVWAVRQGAQVVNLSLGGSSDSAALSEAIAFAMANDVVVVACTGNASGEGQEQIWYPAREPGVLAVAGLVWTDGEPRHWPSSLTGRETVLAAPAVLTAAAPGGGTRQVQGTSFSAALVSATAALIRSRSPEASAGEVVHRLIASAHDLGDPGRDALHGYGAVDPLRALTISLPPVSANPLDTKARHGQAGFGAAPPVVVPALPGQLITRQLARPPVGADEPERLSRWERAGSGLSEGPVAVAGWPRPAVAARSRHAAAPRRVIRPGRSSNCRSSTRPGASRLGALGALLSHWGGFVRGDGEPGVRIVCRSCEDHA
jgi:type VII secretion-associated serine protease mycosin